VDGKRLAPVWNDFGHVPNLMVFGDAETGKTNTLRLVIESITKRYTSAQARILLGDPGRGLLESVPAEYRVGYAVDTDALTTLSGNAAVSMTARLPAADLITMSYVLNELTPDARTAIVAEVVAASSAPLHVLSHEEEAYLTIIGVHEGMPVRPNPPNLETLG